MRSFDELLEAHLFGLRGEQRKRALQSFVAGAMAASALVRDQLYNVDNTRFKDGPADPFRHWDRKPTVTKTQQIQRKPKTIIWSIGNNPTV